MSSIYIYVIIIKYRSIKKIRSGFSPCIISDVFTPIIVCSINFGLLFLAPIRNALCTKSANNQFHQNQYGTKKCFISITARNEQ